MFANLYVYLFGSENNNRNDVKKTVDVASDDSAALVASNLSNENRTFENDLAKEDGWVLLDGLPSGRSSPVFVSEPDLIAIDDDDLSTDLSNSRTHSPVPMKSHTVQHHHHHHTHKHVQRLEAKLKGAKKNHLERKLFEDNFLSRTLPLLKETQKTKEISTASKMKRSTAAGYASTELKTKPRSKKGFRLAAGRNNDRKVNNLH